MWTLGISCSHNGSVALVHDGRVACAIQAERLSRVKRQSIYPDRLGTDVKSLAQYCLEHAQVSWDSIDVIAVSTPWKTVPPTLAPVLRSVLPDFPTRPRLVSVPHHLAHAEYALHWAPATSALVLVCDGSGTYEGDRTALTITEDEDLPLKYLDGIAKESISAYRYDGHQLRLVYRVGSDFADASIAGVRTRFIKSLGHIWRWAAWYCCGDLSEAGKVMGLAPFARGTDIPDLSLCRFDQQTGKITVSFDRALALPSPRSTGGIRQDHRCYAPIAAQVQELTNSVLVDLTKFLLRRHPSTDVFFTGGVALNGIANQKLANAIDGKLHLNGSCEDNGTAIGAALAADVQVTGARQWEQPTEYLGRCYAEAEIRNALARRNLSSSTPPYREMLSTVAHCIAAGGVVGWFQGRSEFGPRALGNRSILADPRRADMRDNLNRVTKERESYRPYAPAVLLEECGKFFDLSEPSPAMLRVVPSLTTLLPAVTHVDGSARVQTVRPEDNPRFYDLIERFGQITGLPVLLNTSFNRSGEPIVETPDDAIDTFIAAGLDLLVIGDSVVRRVETLGTSSEETPPDSDDISPGDTLTVRNAPRLIEWSAGMEMNPDCSVLIALGARLPIKIDSRHRTLLKELWQNRTFKAIEALSWSQTVSTSWPDVKTILVEMLRHGFLLRRRS